MEKSHKSAVIIAPPISLCDQIQKIRKKHDRAYERWMPHINMVYPFYEDRGNVFAQEARKMSLHFSAIKPFKVSFTKDSIGFFRHNTRTIVWIRPLMPEPTPPSPSPPKAKAPKVPKPKKVAKSKPAPPPPVYRKLAPKHGTNQEYEETFWTDTTQTDFKQTELSRQADPDWWSEDLEIPPPNQEPVVLAPKSFPKPPTPTVQHDQHTLLGYPEPVPASTKKYAPATGLDALCRAFWSPEDTKKEIKIAEEACSTNGLDALRFAFCGLPDGKDQTCPSFKGIQHEQEKESQRYVTFTKVLSDVTPIQKESLTAAPRIDFIEHFNQEFPELAGKLSSAPAVVVESSSSEEESESETSDDEAMEDEAVDDYAESWLPPRADGHHPHVMNLQYELDRHYPDLNDLGTKSEAGFQPHLTLGQFDNRKALEFIADLKKKFVDFTFEVKELQMISRKGNLEPFEVKMTVPLGVNQASVQI